MVLEQWSSGGKEEREEKRRRRRAFRTYLGSLTPCLEAKVEEKKKEEKEEEGERVVLLSFGRKWWQQRSDFDQVLTRVLVLVMKRTLAAVWTRLLAAGSQKQDRRESAVISDGWRRE